MAAAAPLLPWVTAALGLGSAAQTEVSRSQANNERKVQGKLQADALAKAEADREKERQSALIADQQTTRQNQQLAEQRRRRAGGDRGGTLLTGAGGLGDSSSGSRKTLLGL